MLGIYKYSLLLAKEIEIFKNIRTCPSLIDNRDAVLSKKIEIYDKIKEALFMRNIELSSIVSTDFSITDFFSMRVLCGSKTTSKVIHDTDKYIMSCFELVPSLFLLFDGDNLILDTDYKAIAQKSIYSKKIKSTFKSTFWKKRNCIVNNDIRLYKTEKLIDHIFLNFFCKNITCTAEDIYNFILMEKGIDLKDIDKRKENIFLDIVCYYFGNYNLNEAFMDKYINKKIDAYDFFENKIAILENSFFR